jgi:hypothetical protein
LRKLAILALLAALAIPAMATPAVVQTCFGTGYQTTAYCSFTNDIAANDVIVLVQMDTSFGAATPATPSGCGVTWNLIDEDSSTGFAEFVAADPSGGACSAGVVSTDSTARHNVMGLELSGVTATVDAHGFIYQTAIGSPTSPTITTTVSGDAVFSANADYAGYTATWTVSSPYTKEVDNGSASLGQYSGGVAMVVQTSAGSQTGGSWTNTGGGTSQADSGTFALEPSGAGPPPCPPTLMTLGVGCG